jgi:hypothetical protein
MPRVCSIDGDQSCVSLVRLFNLDELPAEPALDAQITAGYIVIKRRCHPNDLAVLFVHGQVATHAAIGTDGDGLMLA